MTVDPVTTIDLLRHGEPEGGRRYRGSVDDPLSALGWSQMRAAAPPDYRWQVIISSPLQRCVAFAQELAQHRGLALEIEPNWREMSFGDWEGRTLEDIAATAPEALERFWRDPLNHPPPGGEAVEACSGRVITAWQHLLARHAGRHVLVVAHGGTIRLALCHILEIPLRRLWRLEVPYANLSRIRLHGSGERAEPALVFHGRGVESSV